MKITQPTLSHHMKQLTESGLVNVKKIGTWNHYSINKDTMDRYVEFLNDTHKPSDNSGICECK